MPGEGWDPPTQTTPVMIVHAGKAARKGSSLPTPFCRMTIVVEGVTAGAREVADAASAMALWVQTTKEKGPGASAGVLITDS